MNANIYYMLSSYLYLYMYICRYTYIGICDFRYILTVLMRIMLIDPEYLEYFAG